MVVATDLEGVLVPELWECIAAATKTPALARTTRDEPDFERLMADRLQALDSRRLRLDDLQAITREVPPDPGAIEFLAWVRSFAQVFIVSDTFHELSEDIVQRLGGYSLFANRFRVDAEGRIVGVRLRIRGQKDRIITSIQEAGFRVVAIGDSSNDERILRAANDAVLYNATSELTAKLPQARRAFNFAELRVHLEEIRAQEENSWRPGAPPSPAPALE